MASSNSISSSSSDTTTLLSSLGSSNMNKEQIAQYLHQQSAPSSMPVQPLGNVTNFANQKYNLQALSSDQFGQANDDLVNEFFLSMALNQFSSAASTDDDRQMQIMNLLDLNASFATFNNEQPANGSFFGTLDQNNNSSMFANMNFASNNGSAGLDFAKFNNIYSSPSNDTAAAKSLVNSSFDNGALNYAAADNSRQRRRYSSYSNMSENMQSPPSPSYSRQQHATNGGYVPNPFATSSDLGESTYGKSMAKCAYTNCSQALISSQDSNLIQYKCCNCNATKPIHRRCYESLMSDRSKANMSSNGYDRKRNYSLSQIFDNNAMKKAAANPFYNEPIRITCFDCQRGGEFNGKPSMQTNSKASNTQLSSKSSLPNMLNSNQNGLMNHGGRKKSFILNNPPLSSPMKPVLESRSPSPANRTNPYTINPNLLKPYKNPPKMENMSKNNHRTRTMSAGSPGSTIYSSGFVADKKMPGGQRKSEGIVIKRPNDKSREKAHSINLGNNTAFSLGDQGLSMAGSLNSSGSFLDNLGEKLAATGNMFHSRIDWSILNKVPYIKQNSIHIRLEDEGPYGNDETRCFVLSHLSSLKIREIRCCVCETVLPIYDRFPLVDGTLFVSPINYDTINLYGNLDDVSRSESPSASSSSSSCSLSVRGLHSELNQFVKTDKTEESKDSQSALDAQKSASELQLASGQLNQTVLTSIPATVSNKGQYIYAICLDCLHGPTSTGDAKTEENTKTSTAPTTVAGAAQSSSLISQSDINNNNEQQDGEANKASSTREASPSSSPAHVIKCKYCKQAWGGGSVLQIGTMYKYEIFAAFPCCAKRYACLNCSKPVISEPLPYFSSYSEERECPHCHTRDYHFIKPLTKSFDIPTKPASVATVVASASSSLSMSPPAATGATAIENELFTPGVNSSTSDILFML